MLLDLLEIFNKTMKQLKKLNESFNNDKKNNKIVHTNSRDMMSPSM